MSIREEIKEQNEKAFKNLPFKKKIGHFWHYYKIPFFVILATLIFVTYVILRATIFAPHPYGFSVIALNSTYCLAPSAEEVENLMLDFAEYENINPDEYQVLCDVSSSIDLHSSDTYNMAVDMRIVAQGEAGELDCLIGDGEIIEYYMPNQFYQTTIDQFLSPKTFEYLKSNNLIYYYHDEEENKDYPLGVYIKDAPKIKEIGLYSEEYNPVIAIVTLSERTQTAADFIDYIFEQTGAE